MSLIVLAPFLQNLAVQNPIAFSVCPETMAHYRKISDLSNVQYGERRKVELLVTALLFRPSDKKELARLWGQNRHDIARWVVQGLDIDSIEITEQVDGQRLKEKIFEATLIRIKSDDTLENYAKELSQRSKMSIRFHKNEVFEPEIATAFARLAIEKRQIKKQVGYETAFKRWGYVPSVQLQAV